LKSDRPKGRRFPAKRAFVVQFSAEALGTRDSFNGRAEHVATGRAAHFATVEELLAFVENSLRRLRETDEAGGRRGEVLP
jgi:hypothetical protein